MTLWQGQPHDAPQCPDGIAWEGWAPLDEPPVCPACSCAPAEVTCAPPPIWTARSAACTDNAQYEVDISPPPGWDGSCTSENAIEAGWMCSGDPCAWSIDFGVPEMSLAPCEPVATPAPQDLIAPVFVRACEAPREACAGGWCGGVGDCIFQRGDHACPSPWDARTVLSENAPDAGECTPCTCGPPTGGDCLMYVSVFRDSDCTLATFITQTPLSTCSSVSYVLGAESKASEVRSSTPGSCIPTGGEMVSPPPDPVTFCCQ